RQLFFGECTFKWATDPKRAYPLAFNHHWGGGDRLEPRNGSGIARQPGRILCIDVGYRHNVLIEYGRCRYGVPRERPRIHRLEFLEPGAVISTDVDYPIAHQHEADHVAFEQSLAAFENLVENGRGVGNRAADCREHFT